jgi:hypothetical protein
MLSIPVARAADRDPGPLEGEIHWPTVAELREEHTPEQEIEMRKFVWMTPLGLLVRDYLFNEGSPRNVNRLANRITYRMFSSGPLAIGRQTALNMMKRDLFESNGVDQRVLLRFSQLESDIALKKVNVEEKSTDTLAYKLVVPALLGSLWGFPSVRNGGTALAKKIVKIMKSWRNDEGAAAMMTYLKYSAEGAGVSLGGYLTYHNFMATGGTHPEGLLSRYSNKWLQSRESIRYL